MPWLKFHGTSFNQEQKKNLATQFGETLSRILNVPKEMVGIEFKIFQPENLYMKGTFQSEAKGMPVYHLHMYLPPTNQETKNEIYRSLTQITGKVLNLTEEHLKNFGISLQELPLDNYSLGGKPMTEMIGSMR